MIKILRIGSAAAAAAGVILATGAFTSAPAAGSHTARSVSSARTSFAVRPARVRAASGTSQVLPGQPMIQVGTPGRRHSASTAPGPRGTVRSYNWAGYAATRNGRSFRFVAATFFVPYLNCAVAPGSYSAHWVGFDGFYGRPDSVEQDGIEADCVGPAGKTARYRAWYEMFPKPETVTGLKVASGDSITASVSYSSATRRFRLTVADNTTRRHFSVTRACATHISCPRTSAQVISEAPADNQGQLLPMADYGAAAFANIAIINGAGQHGGLVSGRWRTTKIVQYGAVSRQRIAQPTAIHGDSFANYWLGSS